MRSTNSCASRSLTGAIVVKANWRDNPWFPPCWKRSARLDLQLYPERYDHIWEGEYVRAFEGAYFAQGAADRTTARPHLHVAADPVLPVRAYLDIGGAGAKSDADAIWIVQFVGREIRVLDYIEGIGQPIGYYVDEMRQRGWKEAIICTAARWRRHQQRHRQALRRSLARRRL